MPKTHLNRTVRHRTALNRAVGPVAVLLAVVPPAVASPAAEPDKVELVGTDLSTWRADGKGFEGHPPKLNASRPPGKWQSFDVVFRAPRFNGHGKKIAHARFVKVVHNGKLVHENVEVTGPTRAATFGDEKPLGPLMLQGDHGPVAFRNIRLEPIRP